MSDFSDNSKVLVGKLGDMVKMLLYTLFLSGNLGSMIIFVYLKGENYNEWSMEMLNVFRVKKKSGFIDGFFL